MPKSATLTRSSAPKSRLSGLTSRCRTPWRCACSSPCRAPSITAHAHACGGCPAISRVVSVPPRHAFHHERAQILLFDVVEDADDVRVVERGEHARLGREALARVRGAQKLRRE